MTSVLDRLPPLLRHLGLAVVAAVIIFVVSGQLSQITNTRLAIVAFILCAVAGLTVLTGLNGQISLGHGALMAVGAYTVALRLQDGGSATLALLLAVVVTLGVGVAAGAAAARLRGPYLAGATLALAVGLPSVTNRFPERLGGDTGLTLPLPTPPGWLGSDFDAFRYQFLIAAAGALIVLVVLANLTRSRFGRNFRAVRDDEVAAALAGINVSRTQVLAFVVSAGCAGLAGGLLALVTGSVGPQAFSLILSLTLLTAIVVGGLGSLIGAVWGSIAVVYLPIISTGTLAPALGVSQDNGPNLAYVIYGVLLILLMLTAPQGIQGGLRRLRALLQGPGSGPRAGDPHPGEAAEDVTVEEYDAGAGPGQPSPVTPAQQPGVAGSNPGSRP